MSDKKNNEKTCCSTTFLSERMDEMDGMDLMDRMDDLNHNSSPFCPSRPFRPSNVKKPDEAKVFNKNILKNSVKNKSEISVEKNGNVF